MKNVLKYAANTFRFRVFFFFIEKALTINIQQLNTQFGIPRQVQFIAGKGGLPCIKINNEKASALISIYAGQILSFHPANDTEDMLFVSDNAFFQKGKAIKGGIPICWPWFGADPEDPDHRNHGFARNKTWSVSSVDVLENGDNKIKLELVDTVETRKIWPHCFHLSLDIIIGNTLTIVLSTHNIGDQPFSICEALHAYFHVADAAQVQIIGLEHSGYLDKTEDFTPVCQVGAITFSEETDRIYTDLKHYVTLDDPVFNRKVRISSSGNKNVVIWNPWIKGSAGTPDLKNDDYKHFVCVEIANAAANDVVVPPGGEYKLISNYSLINQ